MLLWTIQSGGVLQQTWTSAADFETKRQKHSCEMLFDNLIMYCIWHDDISDGTAFDTAGAVQIEKDLQQKDGRSGSGP